MVSFFFWIQLLHSTTMSDQTSEADLQAIETILLDMDVDSDSIGIIISYVWNPGDYVFMDFLWRSDPLMRIPLERIFWFVGGLTSTIGDYPPTIYYWDGPHVNVFEGGWWLIGERYRRLKKKRAAMGLTLR